MADLLQITVEELSALLLESRRESGINPVPEVEQPSSLDTEADSLVWPTSSDHQQALETTIPTRLSLIDTVQLEKLTDQFEQLDHGAGGRAAARNLALQHFRFVLACLRTSSMSPDTRLAWMRAASRLGRLCGFSSADADDHALAVRAFTAALSLAKEADDPNNRLNILCGLTRQAVQLGDKPEAARLLAEIQSGPQPQSRLSTCMMHAVEARVHGLLGNERYALLAVELAQQAFTQDRAVDDPPWLWYYDEAQLCGDTAHGLFPLAMQGLQVELASERFRRAIQLHRPNNARSIAFSSAKLAILSTRWGDDQALDQVDVAIAAATTVQSARADTDLVLLTKCLDRYDSSRARTQAKTIAKLLGNDS